MKLYYNNWSKEAPGVKYEHNVIFLTSYSKMGVDLAVQVQYGGVSN